MILPTVLFAVIVVLIIFLYCTYKDNEKYVIHNICLSQELRETKDQLHKCQVILKEKLAEDEEMYEKTKRQDEHLVEILIQAAKIITDVSEELLGGHKNTSD